MKTGKTGKGCAGSKKKTSLAKKTLKESDLGVVREQIKNQVANHAVKMVESTIKQVDEGHYLAMKYLFEMIGLCPETAPEKTVEEDSLAKTLLQRLKLPEEIDSGGEVTKDSVADSLEEESDAVE